MSPYQMSGQKRIGKYLISMLYFSTVWAVFRKRIFIGSDTFSLPVHKILFLICLTCMLAGVFAPLSPIYIQYLGLVYPVE
jgi:hypothetical protein